MSGWQPDLPCDAARWPQPDAQAVDWARAAATVLHRTPALRPFQVDGLRAFIDAGYWHRTTNRQARMATS